MKTLILLLIALMVPFQVSWSGEDTTRIWCGNCYQRLGVYPRPLVWLRDCDETVPRQLSDSCYYKCINFKLYRICVTEERESTYLLPTPTYLITTQCGYCKVIYSMKHGHWDCPVLDADTTEEPEPEYELDAYYSVFGDTLYCVWAKERFGDGDTIWFNSSLDTIRVADTLLELKPPIGIVPHSITYRDSIVQVCDTTFKWDGSPASDSVEFAIFFEKSLHLYLWHRIICRDSTVVVRKR